MANKTVRCCFLCKPLHLRFCLRFAFPLRLSLSLSASLSTSPSLKRHSAGCPTHTHTHTHPVAHMQIIKVGARFEQKFGHRIDGDHWTCTNMYTDTILTLLFLVKSRPKYILVQVQNYFKSYFRRFSYINHRASQKRQGHLKGHFTDFTHKVQCTIFVI